MPKMTMSQARAEARRRWGALAWVEHARGALRKSTAADRNALQRWREQKPVPPTLGPLGTNAGYGDAMVRHGEAYMLWRAEHDRLQTQALSMGPYRVGEAGGIAVRVLGYGDSWEDAFADVDGKDKRRLR